MNIKQLSELSGIPYSTVRKYLTVLAQNNLISLNKTQNGVEVNDNAERVFLSFIKFIKSGQTPSEAIKKIVEGNLSQDDAMSLLIEKMERVEEENRKLRELVQMYLSRVENLEYQIKELMPPKRENFFARIVKRFSRKI